MRVLVVSHTYISTINRDKWKQLVDTFQDVTIDVLFPHRWPSCLFNHHVDYGVVERHGRCRFHALKAKSSGNEVWYRYEWQALFALLKEIRPDIIHVEQGVNALSYTQLIMCARILRFRPKFLFFTWVNWQEKRRLSDFLIWRWIRALNCSASAGAITGNRQARLLIEKKMLHKPIIVLPQLGVSQNIFSPAKRAKEPHKKRICYLGRFVEEKGVLLLIDTFKKLTKKIDDWELVFIGKGPLRDILIAQVKERCLLDRVFIKPPVVHEELGELYQSSDIVVLPSLDTVEWREQFGHVLIEAMASRVAVIGSDAGEIPHVIADAGMIFRQADKSHLYNCLYRMMSDDQLRESYAQKGYERAMRLYTHNAIAQKTYAFWQQLLGEV